MRYFTIVDVVIFRVVVVVLLLTSVAPNEVLGRLYNNGIYDARIGEYVTIFMNRFVGYYFPWFL